MPTTALIDGDILVYRVGFAIERDPNAEYIYGYNIDKQIDKILFNTKCCNYKVYLSGLSNFRFDKAKLMPYKDNRKDFKKPKYYQKLRDFLIKRYDATIVEGMEADDALGIEQMANLKYRDYEVIDSDTVICSIDKDLKMIPGHHFNFVKNYASFMTDNDGYFNFYVQMLTGDATDNVPGLLGIGPKTAAKMLIDCKTPHEMHLKALNIYADVTHYIKKINKYQLKLKKLTIEDDKNITHEVFHEIKNLLWIKRGNVIEDMYQGLLYQDAVTLHLARLKNKGFKNGIS